MIRKGDKHLLGNTEMNYSKGIVVVEDEKFPMSSGLMELLFLKHPNQNIITQDDLSHYRRILNLTNAHKKGFQENNEIRRHNSKKFESIISTLFSSKHGAGIVPKYKIASYNTVKDYVYWDDPNELVDRLRLLVSEQSAGNNNHTNEISSIVEELREGYILDRAKISQVSGISNAPAESETI